VTLPTIHRYRGRLRYLDRARETGDTERWSRQLDVRPSGAEIPFAALSGGNQQKVLVAKGLNANPRAVVLDEPTAGVDAAARQLIYDQIRSAAAGYGLAVIVVSSDSTDLVALADRVIILRTIGGPLELRAGEVTEASILENLGAEPTDSMGALP
jgi:ABC-type sugar transport system ATPase subunit